MIETNKQILKSREDKRKMFGEIFTPYCLIEKMFSLFDDSLFSYPDKKWLDVGAGTGYFSIFLYNKLFEGLKKEILNEEKRKNHIIENMIFMVEIQKSNCQELKQIFGNNANIINKNYLEYSEKFDFIIGNPPYNSHGFKKVPSNNKFSKINDGKTIWIDFVKHSVDLLNPMGYLLFITPSIWLKPDKANIYSLLTNLNIIKLHTLSNTQTNNIFSKQAQTPTVYFLLQNTNPQKPMQIFDSNTCSYIPYYLYPNFPIPVYGIAVIQKLIPFILKYGSLEVYKSNLINKDLINVNGVYKNIRTATLNDLSPQLVIENSNIKLPYFGEKKLVLPHKMYGFPFYDNKGEYGISNRDNYIIKNKTDKEFKILQNYLSTNFALYIFESTRYRMKFLEKQAFLFLPDITKIPNIKNHNDLQTIFNLSDSDINYINSLHKKKYTFKYSP